MQLKILHCSPSKLIESSHKKHISLLAALFYIHLWALVDFTLRETNHFTSGNSLQKKTACPDLWASQVYWRWPLKIKAKQSLEESSACIKRPVPNSYLYSNTQWSCSSHKPMISGLLMKIGIQFQFFQNSQRPFGIFRMSFWCLDFYTVWNKEQALAKEREGSLMHSLSTKSMLQL